MRLAWKIALCVCGVAVIALTPVVWHFKGANAGTLTAATVQIILGVAALVIPWFVPTTGPVDHASDTGKSRGINGGRAQTGVKRPSGKGGGSATAERTGDATADGSGSSASTGVDYSD
ncbi:hypothetical protein ABIA33_007571 [Streptacidiphilus sp. MAP12-16]